MKRRAFLQMAGVAAAAGLGQLSGIAPTYAQSRAQGRVVVIGGGFGGSIAAKYVKRRAPGIDVTLIEKNRVYHTCPYSNLVLSGERTLDSIAFTYDQLESRHGVKMVYDEVVRVDTNRKQVRTQEGQRINYDRLIVSPGISLRFEAIDGYSEALANDKMPHAWKAGPQTELLRKQLEAMPDGGVFIMVAPPNPYRCPPGPPERASQVASYFQRHKPKSKVLILDYKDAFSKQGLFTQGWNHFGFNIEWVAGSRGGRVVEVLGDSMTLLTDDLEEHRGDVINVIPPQKAGAIAEVIGLTDDTGWCPVNQRSFESKLVKDVHVIGDSAIAGALPKSGYAANSMAKICASAVVGLLAGDEPPAPEFTNTCYSHVGPEYGISVAGVYQYNDADEIVGVPGAGGLSAMEPAPGTRLLEAVYADGWYNAIVKDMFT